MNLSAKAEIGAKWSAITMAISAFISILQISILTHYLLPSDFGVIAILLVFTSILNVFVSVGLTDVVIVKINATPKQLSTLYWLNMLVGLATYLLLFFIVAPALIFFSEDKAITLMARIIGLSILFSSVSVQFRSFMKRDLYIKKIAIIDLFAHICGFTAAVLLIFNGFGIWTLIFSILLQHFVSMTIFLYYARQYKWLPNFNFNLTSVSEMIRFGAHRIVSSLLHQMYSRADQITIGALLGPSALGIYSVAYNLSMQPFLRINPILTQISFPVFSRISFDSNRILRAYRKGLRVLIFINAPLLLGMLATASLIVPIVLGAGWDESVLILQILCIYGLLRSSGNINTGLILAFEKYQWPTYWNLFLLFFTPLVIFVAYQIKDSLIMLTVAVLFIEFLLAIVSYFLFSRRLLGGFGIGYLNDLGRPFFISILMAITVIFFQNKIDLNSEFLELIILIFIGALSYLLLTFILAKNHMKEFWDIAKSKL